MGVPVLCTVKTAWLPAAASRRGTAAGARVLDGIIQQDHRQPMQGGGIPCTVWPGFVRYNQDIHRQISFGFLQFIDTVYHN